jgi:hypothetical protein
MHTDRCVFRYIDGFISALKSYVDHFGALGKEYFKNAVTKGELTVTVNELGASVRLSSLP